MTGMRRDSTADADVGELTDESPAPQFIEHERTQILARRYEDPEMTIERWFEDLPTVNVRAEYLRPTQAPRLAKGTKRQPVPPRREPTPTPTDLDASYAAAMRALR